MHHVTVCDPVSLSAAFAVGLAGSVHCVAMCGGIAGALGLRARHASTARRASVVAGAYQIGRLAGYTLAGALVGAFGSVMQGFVETSNVNVVTEMSSLITAQRAYEMNSRVISASDDMLSTLTKLH